MYLSVNAINHVTDGVTDHLAIVITSTALLKTYGERAFAVMAPKLWNPLPLEMTSSDSIDIKKKLKHLSS